MGLQNRAVWLSGGTCIAIGTLVVVGWLLDISTLKFLAPGMLPMKANAAIGFILLGLAVICRDSKKRLSLLLRYCASALLLILSVATLAECALDCDVGINELLIRDNTFHSSSLIRPGRMSPVTAASFLLLLVPILRSPSASCRARWFTELCILLPLLASTRALVGFVYGVPVLQQLGQSAGMALHTTIALFVASIGLQMAQRDSFMASLWESSNTGSKLARRVLLWAVGVPILLGLICVQCDRLGWVNGQVGITIFATLMVLLLARFLVAWSRRINELDHELEVASEAARDHQLASEKDALTGLLNRRGFFDQAERVLVAARHSGGRLACVLLDIDFFKKINDTYGHSTGDDVLCQFASFLRDECRLEDVVGRIGGEEFCILLPGLDEAGARVMAERLRIMIENRPIRTNEAEFVVTTSGGVAGLAACHSSIHSLIDSADAALLVSKQTGRNKITATSQLAEDSFSEAYCGPLAGLCARDVMVPVLADVGLSDSVRKTAQRLMELNLDSLPVVDGEGKPVGFVTEQDLLNSMIDSAATDQCIADCGRLSVAVFDETAPAEQIASFFSRSAVQRVVIVRETHPVGVVSRRTLLRWLFNHGFHRPSAFVETKNHQSSDLDNSIDELKARVSRLAEIRETASGAELNSSVIGEATRIQESVESLLISCRDRSNRHTHELLTAGALSLS